VLSAFDADNAQEHDFRNEQFCKTIMLNVGVQRQSGWLGVTGKEPVTRDRDARHPNDKNHGRIAGR
jgi:hypothetical protein